MLIMFSIFRHCQGMSSELTAYERERRKQMAAHAKMLESTGIEAQREELRTACAPKPKSI